MVEVQLPELAFPIKWNTQKREEKRSFWSLEQYDGLLLRLDLATNENVQDFVWECGSEKMLKIEYC